MVDERFYSRVSEDRLSSRQIDELIGLTRGLCADGVLNQMEVEFLQKWLAANVAVSDHPLVRTLYQRVATTLSDGDLSKDEQADLFGTLDALSNRDFELGEVLKSTTLPLCDPAPDILFAGQRFTFTGTFEFGQRKHCEQAVEILGATSGSLTTSTRYLVVGLYATESWKHSSFGNKILKACEMRDGGTNISIVSEQHWRIFL